VRGRSSRHLDSEGGGAATASFSFFNFRGRLAALTTSLCLFYVCRSRALAPCPGVNIERLAAVLLD
jgi:hypothetical protein